MTSLALFLPPEKCNCKLLLTLCFWFLAWIAIASFCSRGTVEICAWSGKSGLGLSTSICLHESVDVVQSSGSMKCLASSQINMPKSALQIKLKSSQKSLQSWMFKNWTINLFQVVYRRANVNTLWIGLEQIGEKCLCLWIYFKRTKKMYTEGYVWRYLFGITKGIPVWQGNVTQFSVII